MPKLRRPIVRSRARHSSIRRPRARVNSTSRYACMYVCMYVCMRVHIMRRFVISVKNDNCTGKGTRTRRLLFEQEKASRP